jgi:hypothetical protein
MAIGAEAGAWVERRREGLVEKGNDGKKAMWKGKKEHIVYVM